MRCNIPARILTIYYEYPCRCENLRGAADLEERSWPEFTFSRHDLSVEIYLKGKFSSVLERDLLREYIKLFFIDALLLAIL